MGTYELRGCRPTEWGIERIKNRSGGVVALRCALAFDHSRDRELMSMAVKTLFETKTLHTEAGRLEVMDVSLEDEVYCFSLASLRTNLPPTPMWWHGARKKQAFEEAIEHEMNEMMRGLATRLVAAWNAAMISITPRNASFVIVPPT